MRFMHYDRMHYEMMYCKCLRSLASNGGGVGGDSDSSVLGPYSVNSAPLGANTV
jgi:hypothetical protein